MSCATDDNANVGGDGGIGVGPASPATPLSAADKADYDPEIFFEVSYQSLGYLCVGAQFSARYPCVHYSDGPGPASNAVILAPDLYCSGTKSFPDCSELWFPTDLAEYDRETVEGDEVICSGAGAFSAPGDSDCYIYSGGDPGGVAIGQPDYKCSQSGGGIDCATDYYPSAMADYEQYTVNGGNVICTDAGISGGFGDLDCYRYNGGDPSQAVFGTPDYKCTPSGLSVDCAPDYYPSEMEGVTIVSIDGDEYVCQETFQGEECFAWFGQGSPSDAIGFRPDYYCNFSGCSRDDYP